MNEKTFTIGGTYKEKRGLKTFLKQVKAVNQNFAKEKTYSEIGSKHKVKRNQVKIKTVEETK